MDEAANEAKDVRRDSHSSSSSDESSKTDLEVNSEIEVKRLETPVKRKNDNKEYRAIELPNGLKALLIAVDSGADAHIKQDSQADGATGNDGLIVTTSERIDSNIDADIPFNRLKTDEKMAAFGLSIGVGSYNDPPEVPGMARFLEHMVVIGSEKYPQEYGFDSFIKGCGGYVDAYTGSDQTTFKVTVPEHFLSDALDRFAQFFIEPLLKRATVGRVRQFVIHRDNITNEVLYEKLHRFRKRFYRAHNMTLTITAGLSLDTLENWVKNCFLSLPNDSLPFDYFAEFTATDLLDISGSGRIYVIKSITHDFKMETIWRFPSMYLLQRSKPLQYISWLLCHNGKGSLIRYLRKNGWCSDISSDIRIVRSNCTKYAQCTLTLFFTDDGFAERSRVEKIVYSYINFIRKEGPQKRIYDEISKVEEAKLSFSEELGTIDPFDLCKTMPSTSPVDYATGNDRYFEYDPDSIEACVNLFIPAKSIVVYYWRGRFSDVKYSAIEPWFKMSYGFKDESKEILESYGRGEPITEFYFPEANPFVTDEFNLIPAPENSPRYPIKIHTNAMCEIWHKPDTKFKLPKCHLNVHYISPLPLALPENAAMLDLFVSILKPLAIEELYPATVAGLEYEFHSSEKGLIVEVYGFNQKITLLTTTITRYIAQCSELVTEDLFAKMKKEQRAMYYNDVLSIPENLAEDTRLSIVRLIHWSTIQKRDALSGIKLEEFRHFIKCFTYHTYIQCLGQGNIEGIDVIQNVQDCIAILGCGALHRHARPYMRLTEVPLGVRCCRVKSRDPNDSRSAVVNYYQLPNTSITSATEILNMILHDPSFEEFRNQKRLECQEYHLLMDSSDEFGYFIEGNSESKNVGEIDEDIEKFRKSLNDILKELSEQEMLTVTKALLRAKKCTDLRLKEEVDRNWSAIISETYVFDHVRREIDAISSLTVTDLKSSIIGCTATGPNLRKLSVQVVGNDSNETSTVSTEVQEDGMNGGGEDGSVLPVSQNAGGYPAKRAQGDYPLEYLTDSPNAEKKIDYYITDIEEYKRSLGVFSVHNSGV